MSGEDGARLPYPKHNLFTATQRLTPGRENHLTEFFASALLTAPGFADGYVELLLASRAPSWGRQRFVSATTQAAGFAHAIPDLLVAVEGIDGVRRTVAVEHKIEAAETVSVRGESVGDLDATEKAPDPMKQLEWYLQLPGVDGVAYVRQAPKRPDPAVLEHERYLRPASGASHFLWSDFADLLAAHQEESLVVGWLADAFARMGYTPANASIGDLQSADEQTRREARENLAKLWLPMRTEAENLGWHVETGSVHEVYLNKHPHSVIKEIWVNPLFKATRLAIRFTPMSGADAPAVFDRLKPLMPAAAQRMPLAHEPELALGIQKRTAGPGQVVQVTSSLGDVVGHLDEPAGISARLADFILPLIRPFS